VAREIIITGVDRQPDGATVVACVFWINAPANRVRPLPASAASQLPTSPGVAWGVTTAEQASLTAGSVVEQGYVSGQFPSGTGAAAIQAGLQTAYAAAQAALNNAAPAARFIGASWDGTTWTAAP
jgi:hypothetical protein